MADLMDMGRYTPRNVMGYGGAGGENPVSAFMQGYQFVNNLQHQDAADQQDQQTQALKTQLLQGQIDAQNIQNQNATTAAANAATAAANQKQINTNKAIAAQLASNPDPDALHANFSDEELNGAFGPLLNHPLLAQYATPEGRMQFKQGYNTLAAALPSDANNNTFNQDQAKTGFTQMFKPQIMAQVRGKVPNAIDAEVATIYPAQGRPGQFYTTLNVKKADGSSEIVPWTMNGTNDPDDKVKPFDITKVMDVAQRNALLVHHLDLQDAKMGDQETQKRLEAESQNNDLIQQAHALPPDTPIGRKQQALYESALRANKTPGEAALISSNLAPDSRGTELDIEGKRLRNQAESINNQQGKAGLNNYGKEWKLADGSTMYTDANGNAIMGRGEGPATARNQDPANDPENWALGRRRQIELDLARMKSGSPVSQALAQSFGMAPSSVGKAASSDQLQKAQTAAEQEMKKLNTYISPEYGGSKPARPEGGQRAQGKPSSQGGGGVDLSQLQGEPSGCYKVNGRIINWDGKQVIQ